MISRASHERGISCLMYFLQENAEELASKSDEAKYLQVRQHTEFKIMFVKLHNLVDCFINSKPTLWELVLIITVL